MLLEADSVLVMLVHNRDNRVEKAQKIMMVYLQELSKSFMYWEKFPSVLYEENVSLERKWGQRKISNIKVIFS